MPEFSPRFQQDLSLVSRTETPSFAAPDRPAFTDRPQPGADHPSSPYAGEVGMPPNRVLTPADEERIRAIRKARDAAVTSLLQHDSRGLMTLPDTPVRRTPADADSMAAPTPTPAAAAAAGDTSPRLGGTVPPESGTDAPAPVRPSVVDAPVAPAGDAPRLQAQAPSAQRPDTNAGSPETDSTSSEMPEPPRPRHAYPYDAPPGPRTVSLNAQAEAAIHDVRGPVIEVGGPTVTGMPLLGDREVLPSEPIITNFEQGPGVQQVLDATAMDLPDASVGMVMINNFSIGDYFGNGASGGRAQRKLDEKAQAEWSRAADPSFRPEANLHLKVLQEVTRVTEDNGVLLFGGAHIETIDAARAMGWEVVQQAYTPASNWDRFDVVLVKRPGEA